jgi:hypothetical protein
LQALTEGFTEGHIAADIIIISPALVSGHLCLPTNLVQMASPGPSRSHARRVGAILKTSEMKPRIDPGLRDLLGLFLLGGGGCGLALSQGDLLFVAIFGGACAVIAIETLRRLP